MKNFEEFRRGMETDEEFVAKAFALLEGVTDKQARVELLVKFAAENGYNVSVEDFTRAEAGNHEISEEELELVSGGGGNGTEWCWGDYGCRVAWNTCIVDDECFSGTYECKTSNHCESTHC